MRKFIKKHAALFKSICMILFIYVICIYFYKFSDILLFNQPKILRTDDETIKTFATNNLTSYKEQIFDNIKITIPTTNNNAIVYIVSDELDVSYLSNYLANQGYLCINFVPSSLDEIEDVIERTINSIYNTNDGFGEELLEKGNREMVSIVGIGKAGGYALEGALSSMDKFDINVVSTLLIAPLINSIDMFQKNVVPKVPIGIVLPEFDGIIRSLDGQTIYNEYLFNENIIEPISAVYLFGANHNFFYETILEDDALNIDMVKNTSDDIENLLLLSSKEQQDFLKKYTLEFLNFYHEIKGITNIGLEVDVIAPNKIFNQKVLTSLVTAKSFPIISPTLLEVTNYNNLGGRMIMSNASISQIKESYIAPHDSAISFLHPGLFVDLGLLKLSWNVDTGNFTTTIPQIDEDFSSYGALSIWIATNPSSSLNTKTKQQSFVLTLHDKIGQQEHILLSMQNALAIPNGKEIATKYQKQWSTFTPLSNIRIPLEMFTKVDLTNIVAISFDFNQTQSGSIYIGDLRLLK